MDLKKKYSAGLEAERTARKQAEKLLRQRSDELSERVKQLNCLFNLSELVEKKDGSMDEILQGCVDLLPTGMRYPEAVAVKLIYGYKKYRTIDFDRQKPYYSVDVLAGGQKQGSLAFYVAKSTPEGIVFNDGERRLIQTFAECIGRIIDRKNTKDRLRQSELRYRLLIESVEEGITIVDENERFSFVNSAACKIFGYTKEELIGANLKLIVPEQNYEQILERSALCRQGKSSKYETMILKKSGELRMISVSTSPFIDEQGRFAGTLNVCSDITEQKRIENEIKRLSMAVEQSPVSIMITDVQGGIEYVNPAFIKLSGYDYQEALGQNPRILKSGETPSTEYKKLWQTISSGQVWQGEFHNKKKNGDLYWEKVTIGPIKDDQGRIMHYLAIKEDISERKRLEEELLHTQKIKTMGTLVGGIAHEFNNILTPVIGFTTMALDDTQAGSQLHQNLQQVLQNAGRAKNLVEQLQIYSRKNHQGKRLVQLQRIVEESLRLMQASLPASIRINQDLQDETGSILADTAQIQQVIVNLCANAFQSMAGSGGVLSVSLKKVNKRETLHKGKSTDAMPDFLQLTVQDTGVGMDAETLGRIFDPFFTTRPAGEGNGMGLAIVQSIIENHNGFITVSSQPGQGSIFKIYLPLSMKETVEEPITANLLPHGSERILFVDDDHILADLGFQILSRLGYQVTIATDPVDALQRFKTQPQAFDLVISDMTMPVMSGCELAAKMMRIRKGLPVILCSGYSDLMSEEKMKSLGIREFISKPLQIKDFSNKVRKVLNEK